MDYFYLKNECRGQESSNNALEVQRSTGKAILKISLQFFKNISTLSYR